MICTYYSQNKKLEIELLKLITTRIIMKRVKSYFKVYDVLGYQAYEDKLDELFAEKGLKTGN